MSNRIEQEVARALESVDRLLVAWTEIGEHQRVGKTHQTMYNDIVEFANLRMETVSTIALLVRSGRVSDALGLTRSLLEHALLLRLMTKGSRYFQVEPEIKRTRQQWRDALSEARAELEDLHDRGEALSCLSVQRYPGRGRDRRMWVYEGLKNETEPDFIVPVHYFHYNEFRPDVYRLDDDYYFDPVPSSYRSQTRRSARARRKHRDEAGFRYRYFLSYEALLICLSLNQLASAEEVKRIEAHYTFLGQFLHPTNRASRQLHGNSNHYMGGFHVGLPQPYDADARLLAALYAVHLAAMVANEVADMLDAAPRRYLAEAGTSPIRALLDEVEQRFNYFWFVYNDAPLYDRYIYAINEASDEELGKVGGYPSLSTDNIKFDAAILEHLRHTLRSWNNLRVGAYRSPLR